MSTVKFAIIVLAFIVAVQASFLPPLPTDPAQAENELVAHLNAVCTLVRPASAPHDTTAHLFLL